MFLRQDNAVMPCDGPVFAVLEGVLDDKGVMSKHSWTHSLHTHTCFLHPHTHVPYPSQQIPYTPQVLLLTQHSSKWQVPGVGRYVAIHAFLQECLLFLPLPPGIVHSHPTSFPLHMWLYGRQSFVHGRLSFGPQWMGGR